MRENIPLAQAIEELRRAGHPDLPRFTAPSPPSPRPAHAGRRNRNRRSPKSSTLTDVRRIWMGSLEITELIRRRLAHEISSPATSSSFGNSSLTSPFGGNAKNQKASGSTSTRNSSFTARPNRTQKSRSADTKSNCVPTARSVIRFALPDGKYDLPAVAVSAGGDDARAADLKFSRATQYLGDVGAHPQDPSLKPPLARKPLILPMEAPERGALMLVRFIAATLICWRS